MIKRVTLLLFILLVFWGCEEAEQQNTDIIIFIPNARLPIDGNGYYHMTLLEGSWQTLHRISGWMADQDTIAIFGAYVGWSSSHYWKLGDTLGYIVNTYLNNEGVYVSVDTSYIIGFDGMEVPTCNSSSLSNQEGEVNTMFAPVLSMRGDTVDVFAKWILNNEWETHIFEIVLD
jgi:hypothetical protein